MMLGGEPGVTDQASTNLLYSGEQFDADLQQQYLRARYYDQGSGRFNRLDPFKGSNSDPQSLHKYAYAHLNPVMGVDPSGRATFTLTEMMTVASIVLNLFGLIGNVIAFTKNSMKAKVAVFSALLAVLGGEYWQATGHVLAALYYGTLSALNAVGAVLALVGLAAAVGHVLNTISAGLASALSSVVGPFTGGAALTNTGVLIADAAIVLDATSILTFGIYSSLIAAGTSFMGGKSRGGGGSGSVRRLSNREARKLKTVIKKDGYNSIEELKTPGGKGASKFDLFVESTGDIVVRPKSGVGPGNPTGYNIGDL